jgi:hypothetical protein
VILRLAVPPAHNKGPREVLTLWASRFEIREVTFAVRAESLLLAPLLEAVEMEVVVAGSYDVRLLLQADAALVLYR